MKTLFLKVSKRPVILNIKKKKKKKKKTLDAHSTKISQEKKNISQTLYNVFVLMFWEQITITNILLMLLEERLFITLYIREHSENVCCLAGMYY